MLDYPRVNWPADKGQYRVVQLEIRGEPVLRFPEGGSNYHGQIMKDVLNEFGIRDYPITQGKSSGNDIPASEGPGYRAVGMGKASVDPKECSAKFHGRSDDYGLDISTNHLLLLRPLVPEWKLELDLKEKWESIYSGQGDQFGTKPDRIVLRLADLLSVGSAVLDYGCGEGRNTIHLAERGLSVVAFDFSENGVRKTLRGARERGVADRVKAFPGDALDPKVDGSFDAVACIYVLDYLTDRKEPIDPKKVETVLGHIRQRVKPGGFAGVAFAPRFQNVQTGEITDRGYHEDRLREAFSDWQEVLWYAGFSGIKDFQSTGTTHKWKNNNFDVGLIARRLNL